MVIAPADFEHLALHERGRHWELHRGELREKLGGSTDHNHVSTYLGFQLADQLGFEHVHIRINAGYLRYGDKTYYRPDNAVIPVAYSEHLRGRWEKLEVYERPIPFVVEVWAPWTAEFDVDCKLPVYKRRDDEEIWLIHPHDRTLNAWRRQADGAYTETTYRGGTVEVASLQGVRIDLDRLFDWK
jgi:hypothetical protein